MITGNNIYVFNCNTSDLTKHSKGSGFDII